jgi:hypothetical protein
MMPKQVVLIFIVGVLFFVGIILLVRNHQFREKYSLLWIGISLIFITIPFFIDSYKTLGKFVGIVNPISFFFFFAILTLFLLSVQFTIALTVSFNQRKDITQQMALLVYRVVELEKQLATANLSNGLAPLKNKNTENISKNG